MRIVYDKGKRSNHGFMPVAEVYYPGTYDMQKGIPSAFWSDEYLRFHKRSNTFKAILRCIEKQKYASGTALLVSNWRVGYADVYIIV